MLPPWATEPVTAVTSTNPALPGQCGERAPARDTKSPHQQLPDGWGELWWARTPSSPLAHTPHSALLQSEQCLLGYPLVAQAVALPVSWDRGCGEAASNRCIRAGGPPAEPRRTGASRGACEQSRESVVMGAVKHRGPGPGSGARCLARLSQREQGSSSPMAFCSSDSDSSPPG